MNGEADDLDRAANVTQEMADQAISDVRHRARPEQVQRPDGTWPVTSCDECDTPLPQARIEMGRIRCVYCQGVRERAANR